MRRTDDRGHHRAAMTPGRRRRVRMAAITLVVLLVTVALTAFRPSPDGRVVLEPPTVTTGAGQWSPPVEVQEPPLPDLSAPTGQSAGAGGQASPGRVVVVAPPAERPAPAPTRAAAKPAPAPRYAALAGEGCGQTPTSGYWNHGWFKDWYAVDHGGWTGDGCGGRMIAVPMSGDTNRDDPDNIIVWWFRPPAGGSCAVSVFVPGTGNVMDSAGAPATYFVYGNTGGTGTPVAQFGVDQVRNQGRWTAAGTYPTPTGQLSVRMVTRGIDWGPGRAGAHLGVSAVRITC